MILGSGQSYANNKIVGFQNNRFIGKYNKLTFGNAQYPMTISRVWGRKELLTKQDLDGYSLNTTPAFSGSTYMLALFKNNVGAGNVEGFEGGIINFILYRENSITQELQYLDTLGKDIREHLDYTAVKNNTYKYYITMNSLTQSSSPLVSNYVESTYYGYLLIDVEDEVIYTIESQFSGGDNVQNINFQSYEGNDKFKKYNISQLNYLSGSVSGLVRKSTSMILDNNSVRDLEDFRDFIFDINKTKYLKTRKGEIFKVFTHSYSDNMVDQAIMEVPVISSFNWEQIGDVI